MYCTARQTSNPARVEEQAEVKVVIGNRGPSTWFFFTSEEEEALRMTILGYWSQDYPLISHSASYVFAIKVFE